MSSKETEDDHKKQLNDVLMKYGLLTEVTPLSVTEIQHSSSHTLAGEESSHGGEEEQVYEPVPEESYAIMEEEEQIHLIFPTPSLRKMLPERIRNIEEFNTIHVLPREFNLNFEPEEIPKIAYTHAEVYLEKLSNITGCDRYKTNIPEYWFLDTLAKLLRNAQEDGMDRTNQSILIHWFCEIMKEVETFDAADRKRMLRRFEDITIRASQQIGSGWTHIPKPNEISVDVQPHDNPEIRIKMEAGIRDASYASNMKNLVRIIHYIFDVFSTDFQFSLIRQVFTTKPEYRILEVPYGMNRPKPYYQEQEKVTVPAGKANIAPSEPMKEVKDKSPAIQEPAEYVHLMKLKEQEEKELRELEEKELQELNLKMSILPLSMAADPASIFERHYPDHNLRKKKSSKILKKIE